MKNNCSADQTRLSRNLLITLDDLEKFKRELFDELLKYFQERNLVTPTHWLRSSEVRKILKISAGTLQNLRVSGKLPFKKLGGTLYYDVKDVDAMMK